MFQSNLVVVLQKILTGDIISIEPETPGVFGGQREVRHWSKLHSEYGTSTSLMSTFIVRAAKWIILDDPIDQYCHWSLRSRF
ncbi:hypothetical protein R3I93_007319 [Phoxinus phoxinus]|uniref:Uncharacterized protein n=1 Tax=Phoxinus phoxinus TaxID=58324 RepID=A0AAN9H857_9TELE